MKNKELGIDIIEMRHLLTHLYHKLFLSLLEEHSMTQMELDILLFLANNPEYDTAVDLVKKRHLSKSHVSKSIEELVKKGYIMRCFKDDNHKVIHLSLCDKASELIDAGRIIQMQFATIINDGITLEDASIAHHVIETLMRNAKTALEQK